MKLIKDDKTVIEPQNGFQQDVMLSRYIFTLLISKGKGKVFYGQEPPSGESTTTESWVNYQLLSVMH